MTLNQLLPTVDLLDRLAAADPVVCSPQRAGNSSPLEPASNSTRTDRPYQMTSTSYRIICGSKVSKGKFST